MRRSELREAMASSSRAPKRLREAVATENFVPGKSGKYDAFLCHRGETKKTFTAHLHVKLKDAVLRTFLDYEDIRIGDGNWGSIELAMRNTRVVLVIFSEDFAGSKWCLKELHLARQLMEAGTIRMFPIFYRVTPEYVKESLNSERVKKLQEKGCSKKYIAMWEGDLKNAASIAGFEYNMTDPRSEPEILTKIVHEVFGETNQAPASAGVRVDDLVGVDLVAGQIIQYLFVNNVAMLGLWGVGGIGKTTLAWEIYSRLREYYSASCSVNDVSDKVGQIEGVERVQADILEGLRKGVPRQNVENPESGKKKLEDQLCNKTPFLLLLDDVSNKKDMMEFIITSKMLEGGSMCILTTRDRGVFNAQGGFGNVHINRVERLSSEDSKRVFVYFAFGGAGQVKPGFETVVDEIYKACDGVPLVLKVIGSLLKDYDDVKAWQEISGSGNLCKVHRGVYDSLRKSYDLLSEHQQEIFLDLACGLIGQRKDLAERVWRSLNWMPYVNVELLKRRALVSLDDEGRFVMHDVLRDMGRAIEMEKEKRARLWMPESLIEFKDKRLSRHLQTLVIEYPYYEGIKLDVSRLKDLRVLICGGFVNLSSIPANLRWLSSFHPPLYIPPSSLSFISVTRPVTFPKISQGSKLVVLYHSDLVQCRLSCKRGHQPQCTVQGLGALTALEYLEFPECEFDVLPNLQHLTKLEELHITRSSIKAVPGLGQLSALVKFDASDSDFLVKLPDIRKLTTLEVLHLSRDSKAILGLNKIMPNLKDLTVTAEGLETPFVLNATNLLRLYVYGWSEHGPRAGINSMTLKELTIHCGINGPTKLVGLSGIKNLESISLLFCRFKDVSCLNDLTTLKRIHIYFGTLEILPDLRNLRRLESLNLSHPEGLIDWTLLSRSRSLLEPAHPSLEILELPDSIIKKLPHNWEDMFPGLGTESRRQIREQWLLLCRNNA